MTITLPDAKGIKVCGPNQGAKTADSGLADELAGATLLQHLWRIAGRGAG
jgi:hypothetical protein